MSNWQPKDLTGNPDVEEQIRQYYVKKKAEEEQNKVVFVKGVATEPRKRVEFTIDNSDMFEIPQEEKNLYNRNMEKAYKRFYRADKIRRKHEKMEQQTYSN